MEQEDSQIKVIARRIKVKERRFTIMAHAVRTNQI
jgi:hypothetical protein